MGHVEHRLRGLSYRFERVLKNPHTARRSQSSLATSDASAMAAWCPRKLPRSGVGIASFLPQGRGVFLGVFWEAVPEEPLIFGPAEDAIEAPLWEGCCKVLPDSDVEEAEGEDVGDEDDEDHGDATMRRTVVAALQRRVWYCSRRSILDLPRAVGMTFRIRLA